MQIISDTHCEYEVLISHIKNTTEENIILLGDHGFGLDYMGLPFTTKFLSQMFPNKYFWAISGNHDNQAFMTNEPNVYTITTKSGPQIFYIEGKDILMIPGAYSYDKNLQLMQSSWYEDEQMSWQRWAKFLNEFKVMPFDVIMSHDTSIVNYYLSYRKTDESLTSNGLEYIYNTFPTIPKYSGHLHNSFYNSRLNNIGLGINQSLLLI
jgi:predicted phosphodiesterase